jgi:protein arginine kinase
MISRLPPLNEHAEWLSGAGPEADVVISTRVRLARNFAGHLFVASTTREQKVQIIETARACLGPAVDPSLRWLDLNALTPLDRLLLVERHLISAQHAKGNDPRGLALTVPDERLAVMVNEEDHLRMQVIRSGLAATQAYQQIERVDDAIERLVDYAYHPRFGYLTACPTNCGTGIRVSVMLHLPALRHTGEIEKVKRAAAAMSLAVRGYYGEGSQAVGDFFQISNQTTLGKSEVELLHDFEGTIIPRVVEYERAARRELYERRTAFFEDLVHRSYGVLRHARMLKAEEAMELLSSLRLGLVSGLLGRLDLAVVNQLVLLSQPAHLQLHAGRELDQAARRIERATMVRHILERADRCA